MGQAQSSRVAQFYIPDNTVTSEDVRPQLPSLMQGSRKKIPQTSPLSSKTALATMETEPDPASDPPYIELWGGVVGLLSQCPFFRNNPRELSKSLKLTDPFAKILEWKYKSGKSTYEEFIRNTLCLWISNSKDRRDLFTKLTESLNRCGIIIAVNERERAARVLRIQYDIQKSPSKSSVTDFRMRGDMVAYKHYFGFPVDPRVGFEMGPKPTIITEEFRPSPAASYFTENEENVIVDVLCIDPGFTKAISKFAKELNLTEDSIQKLDTLVTFELKSSRDLAVVILNRFKEKTTQPTVLKFCQLLRKVDLPNASNEIVARAQYL